jgi:hypothetical protein
VRRKWCPLSRVSSTPPFVDSNGVSLSVRSSHNGQSKWRTKLGFTLRSLIKTHASSTRARGVSNRTRLSGISTAVIAKADDGRCGPNYSRVLGHFSAEAISNLYSPACDRGFAGRPEWLGWNRQISLSNLIRDFVLKRFTSHAPRRVNGEP